MKARNLPRWVIPLVILGVGVGVPLIGFVIPVVVLNFVFVGRVGETFSLALSGLISTAASLIFAGHLLLRLQRSREISVDSHLPVSDAETLRQIWSTMAAGYFATGYLAALLHGVVAYRTNLDWTGWLLAISLGILQGAVVVAVGTILAANRPRWSFQNLAVTLFAAVLVLGVSVSLRQMVKLPETQIETVLCSATPGGWVGGVLSRAYLQGINTAWWGIPAACFVVGLSVPAFRRLSSSYHVSEFTIWVDQDVKATVTGPLSRDETPNEETQGVVAELNAVWSGESERKTDAKAETLIREGLFLQPRLSQDVGLVERIVYRRLTPRERDIVEFLAAEETHWGFNFRAGVAAMLGFAALVLVFEFLAGASYLLIGTMAMPVIVGQPWLGFQRRKCGGNCVLYYANYPVGFREVFRAMFRAGLVRSLLILPFVVIAFLVTGMPQNIPPTHSLLYAVGLFVIAMIILTWTNIGFLTGGFRFPSFRWRRLHFYVFPVFLYLGCLVGAMLLLFSAFIPRGIPTQIPIWGAVAMVGCTLAVRFFFQSLDRRGLLDPVARAMKPLEEKQLLSQELMAKYRARAKIARKKLGRFWWLRPKVRQWAHGVE